MGETQIHLGRQTVDGTLTAAKANAIGLANGKSLVANSAQPGGWSWETALAVGANAAGQVAFFTAANAVAGDNALAWDNTLKRLGIGVAAPTTTLHIFRATSGAVRIQDGTEAVGRIFTSDAVGVGTWQPLSVVLGAANRAEFIVGTPSGSYTGSLTVFDIGFTYTPGNKQLMVFYDGDLMEPGGSADYVETSATQITFNSARVITRKITAVLIGNGGGVDSIKTFGNPALTGAVILNAGTNVTLGQVGANITINAAGSVSGSGTAGKLAKWTAAQVLADSIVSESGSDLTVSGNLLPEASGTRNVGSAGFRYAALFLASSIDYSTDLLFKASGVEKARLTTTGRLGVGVVAPGWAVDVAGDVNISGLFRVAGVQLALDNLSDGAGAITTLTPTAPIAVGGSGHSRSLAVNTATSGALGVVQMTQDLGGGGSAPVVTGLQTRPVAATAPGVGQGLVWTGSAWSPGSVTGGAGNLVKMSNTQSGTGFLTTAIIPHDNTIPQNSEGAEVFTVSHTPLSASNRLMIIIQMGMGGGDSGTVKTLALFKDADANALAAVQSAAAIGAGSVPLVHHMIAGTTSPITFRIRVGSNNGTVTGVNLSVQGPLVGAYGGVCASSITVLEVAA